MSGRIDVRRLPIGELGRIAEIDRSEQVDTELAIVAGEIVERPARMAEIPSWEAVGTGPHSIAAQIEFCRSSMERGAILFGGFRDSGLAGLAVVDPAFEPGVAWLAFLYVSRPHRRIGVASAMWDVAVTAALASGAGAMLVSAVPTKSAVGFYLSRGCELSVPPHPVLLAAEPEDVHLVVRFEP